MGQKVEEPVVRKGAAGWLARHSTFEPGGADLIAWTYEHALEFLSSVTTIGRHHQHDQAGSQENMSLQGFRYRNRLAIAVFLFFVFASSSFVGFGAIRLTPAQGQ